MIARALILQPRLIIARRAGLGRLDVSVQAQILNLLVRLQRPVSLLLCRHLPRSGGHPPRQPSGGGHVSRTNRRDRAGPGPFRDAETPLYHGAALRRSHGRSAPQTATDFTDGRCAVAAAPPDGVPLLTRAARSAWRFAVRKCRSPGKRAPGIGWPATCIPKARSGNRCCPRKNSVRNKPHEPRRAPHGSGDLHQRALSMRNH